jgi:uncharacterized protein (DUF885 family)
MFFDKKKLLLLLLVFTVNVNLTQSSARADETDPAAADKVLSALFEDYHEQYMILFPLEATLWGEGRYNDQMSIDISSDFLAKKKKFYASFLERLSRHDVSKNSETMRLAAEILKYELRIRIEGMNFGVERIPFHQFDGLPLSFAQLGSGMASHPFKTVKDYDDWLRRVDAFVIWMNVAEENFRRGSADGYVLPKILVERMIRQCNDPTIVSDQPQENLFFGPITNMPEQVAKSDGPRLRSAFEESIKSKIVPSYQRMGKFLAEEYLDDARTTSGISALPNGREQYLYWTRYWTTTDMTPDEIFAIGEKEVARIRGEMESVKKQMQYDGSLNDFFSFVRNDPKFYPFESPNDVIDFFKKIQNKLEPKLDSLFLNRPKTQFEIRRTEAFREKTASAEYMPGAADGSRPGIFYVPIPDAKKYNVTGGMESLFLHEALPGHHYQIALQQENERLPRFARFLWYGAYGEGWALYCESLGKELGLYSEPEQYLGALGDEMHRAIRLVVDVGIHWKGWSREQAIEYMVANEVITQDSAVAEIERYMAMPGQALSYKIGQLKIRELRTRYEKQLGDRFSLAEFHDQILRNGCMPLSVLERELDEWAKGQ